MPRGRAQAKEAAPRRLLVIAGVFPPAGGGGALRMVKLLSHLPRFGWEPHVIAPHRSGWFSDPELVEAVSGLATTRCGGGRGRLLEGVRRRAEDPERDPGADRLLRRLVRAGGAVRDRLAVPDEHLGWSLQAAAVAERVARRERVDLVMTASFPYSCHLAGLWLQRRLGLGWLADFADPWAGHRHRAQSDGLRTLADARLERWVLERADAITVASPGMRRLLAERYSPAITAKVEELHNAYDPEDFVVPGPGAAPSSARRSDRFELVFVGTFDARLTPPHPFVDALCLLAERRPDVVRRLRLRVLGGADLESSRYIRERLARLGPGGPLIIEGYATHAAATAAMAGAGALLLSVAPGAHWHLTAKVFEYLGSGRPILAVVPEGDCRDLLERCGGAALVRPGDTARLADLLGTAADAGALSVDRAPSPDAIAALRAEEVARGAAALMERLVRSRSTR